MKILFLNTNIGYGGASKMMVDIANSLCDKHTVEFLTFRNDNVLQPLNEKIKHIHSPLFKSKIKPLENLGQIFALHNFLKKGRYDLAIAFLPPANYMLTLAALGTKTKVLLSERGDPYSRKKNGGAFVHLIEHVIHLADGYVFQSNGAKDLYPVKCQKKGTVITNSIPDKFEEFSFSGERKKTIVHVARMELIQKRQDVMLEAFRIFSEKHPEYTLEFYGGGPDEDKVKKMAHEIGIENKVVFMGAKSNVLSLIHDAGMYVLTSDYEGLPNSLLEAVSCGIPSISTDCSPGGARMIINDGENGFIVPCGDYTSLAEKMCVIAEDEKTAGSFSNKAFETRTKFAPENIYDQWECFIKTLMN